MPYLKKVFKIILLLAVVHVNKNAIYQMAREDKR